jgi:hypothetical protein
MAPDGKFERPRRTWSRWLLNRAEPRADRSRGDRFGKDLRDNGPRKRLPRR